MDTKLKVLVGCEYSGRVRDAFIARGHDAISCDLLPSEAPGPHYQGDVRDLLGEPFDLAIFHPDCKYLCNSGVRWLYEREGRWELMRQGAEFFKLLLNSDIPKVAVENPIMHRYAREIIGVAPTQYVQPWEHGEGETKRTGLWLRNLPELRPSNIVAGRNNSVHFASPGPDRWKLRSRTFQGIANAMAAQWG